MSKSIVSRSSIAEALKVMIAGNQIQEESVPQLITFLSMPRLSDDEIDKIKLEMPREYSLYSKAIINEYELQNLYMVHVNDARIRRRPDGQLEREI